MPDPATPELPEPFAALLEMMVAGQRIEALEAFSSAAEGLGPDGYFRMTRAFAAVMLARGIDLEAVDAFTEYAEVWAIMELAGRWVREHDHLSAAMH